MKAQTAKTHKKKIKITEPMAAAALAVVMCKAAVETIRPIVRGYQQKILDYEMYDIDSKWIKRGLKTEKGWVTRPEDTYLMEDSEFKHYLKRCREEQAKANLKTDKPEHCPLLVAENRLIDAERLLIDVMQPITLISFYDVMTSKDALKHKAELVEITLRLLVNTPEFKKVKARAQL